MREEETFEIEEFRSVNQWSYLGGAQVGEFELFGSSQRSD